METTRPSQNREKTWLWLYKIIAGVLIVFLLGLHFVINHLVAPQGLLSWSDVVAYYQNPIIPIIEVIFLIVVVSHSLIGLRSIILDLNPSATVLRGLDILFWVVGVVSIIYGIWLVTVIISFGR
jgi:succinate dehydrogenase / fumarate reductase membrane anchor subunit